jgi:hypothetical protein
MANESSASTLTIEIQIEVFGEDLNGLQFSERNRTLTITRDGATIPLAHKLAPDSEVIIRNPRTNEEALARVVGLISNASVSQVYGIAFIDRSVNLWHVQFPAVQPQNTIVMECGHCHAVDAVLLSEIEKAILESTHALSRYCECSSSSTVWKRTDRKVTKQRITDRRESDRRQKPVPLVPPAPTPQERRKGKRASMKAVACIRRYDSEEVVECENVSRGGFRFKSRKAYRAGIRIEVAVPYAKGGMNIFVYAQIVSQEFSGGFYKHSVAYTESIKKPDLKQKS